MADKVKILLADDEPAVIDLVGKSLKDVGYEVVTASDGDEALSKIISEHPDLVLLDVKMPKKDGFEVCRDIRGTPDISGTPVIIVSALGDEYNKITGFGEGADDYMAKPVNLEELKARVKALLFRSHGIPPGAKEKKEEEASFDKISTGIPSLDKVLQGGLPQGSNILVIGTLGSGKSLFARQFIAAGVRGNEKCMFVALDDDPILIRNELSKAFPGPSADYERLGILRFVDGYSWSTGHQRPEEKFSISGTLDLTQLASVISDAGTELGQTPQTKAGGRRIIDSISSLLVNFDLPSAQRFVSQVARTSIAFGGVTTLFLMEEGAVTEQVLSNIKYLVDGVIELSESKGRKSFRISHMKWMKYSKEWVEW